MAAKVQDRPKRKRGRAGRPRECASRRIVSMKFDESIWHLVVDAVEAGEARSVARFFDSAARRYLIDLGRLPRDQAEPPPYDDGR